MKLFHAEPEKDDREQVQTVSENFERLEETVEALHHRVSQRRTLLKNAEKKIQEFQDSIYAMLIEEDAPKKSALSRGENVHPSSIDAEEDEALFDLLDDDQEDGA